MMKNTPQQKIIKIRKQRRKPIYGKLLKTLSEEFNIMIFTQQLFQIGRGGFGRCYLGKICDLNGKELSQNLISKSYKAIVEDKNIVVVKVIPKNKKQTNQQIYCKQIDNLVSIHRDQSQEMCKNIVKVYPCKLSSDSNFYIVMEFCYHSTLAELIQTRKRTKKRFNLGELLTIMQDLLNGYKMLRNKNILHNDLKPQNIFIKDKIFKIGDFGISTRLNWNNKDFIPYYGTLLYSSIEKIEQKSINHKADIYSMGLILAQIMFGRHPYFDNQSWKQYSQINNLKQSQIYEIEQLKPNPIGKLKINKEQKQKQRDLFLAYIKLRFTCPVKYPILLEWDVEDKQFMESIKRIVLAMCAVQAARPTYEEVINQITKLNKFSLTAWKYQRFPDLHTLTESQLEFQIENLPKESFSQMQMKSLKESKKNTELSLISYDKIDCLKISLKEITHFIKLLYTIAISFNSTDKPDREDVELLKLELFTYLYWVNRNELLIISNQIAQLNQQQLQQLYAQNIQKLLRVNRIDDQHLHELAFVKQDGNHLNEARSNLKNWIQTRYLNNNTITQDNFEQYYLLFIASDLINCEEKFANTIDKSNMAIEIQVISDKIPLLDDQTKDYRVLFEERCKQYVIFFP